MVEYKYIQEIILKCSLNSMREKLSVMSLDEKLSRLTGKLNPLELHEYTLLNRQLSSWEELENHAHENGESLSSSAYVKINRMREILFEYEKRIFRGYDFDKYRGNVPLYDDDSFQSDKKTKTGDSNVLPLEQEQIDSQKPLTEFQYDCLSKYFDSSADINGELTDGKHWNMYSDETKRRKSQLNKEYRRGIDEAMDNGDGLLRNTRLYHGSKRTHLINIHTRVGERVNFKSYISASFNKAIGEKYQEDDFMVEFLCPKGTKGVCGNTPTEYGDVSYFGWEHEYLLGRNAKGTVVDIDYDKMICKVLLDG